MFLELKVGSRFNLKTVAF